MMGNINGIYGGFVGGLNWCFCGGDFCMWVVFGWFWILLYCEMEIRFYLGLK